MTTEGLILLVARATRLPRHGEERTVAKLQALEGIPKSYSSRFAQAGWSALPKTTGAQVLGEQLLRSGTSRHRDAAWLISRGTARR
jgi:hypothetical protein